jgi:tripartite-type tricarboxylate transporter receptor subunit TctC
MAEVAQAALNDPAVRQQLAARGTTPRGGLPADYAALVARERQRWFDVVRQGNVQAD